MKTDVTFTDNILEYENIKQKPNQAYYSSYQNYGTPVNIKQAAASMNDERSKVLNAMHPHPQEYRQEYIQRPLRYYNVDGPDNECVKVLEHIKKCPVCSVLYNHDRTWHIVIIIGLIIIIVILLRKNINPHS